MKQMFDMCSLHKVQEVTICLSACLHVL